MAIEEHIFNALQEIRRGLLVDAELAGIDDAHVHACLNAMIKKGCMYGLAHDIIAAKREGDIADTTRNQRIRQVMFDRTSRLEVSQGIVVVLLDAGRDRQDIGVKDDVLGWKTDLAGEDRVGTLADLELALGGIRLAPLIESHDDHCRTIAAYKLGMLDESFLALLETDGIDHAFALQTSQTPLDHAPLGGVDHHRHARDIRLGSDEVEEAVHIVLRIQHTLVHVDIDDLGAILDLLAGDLDCPLEVSILDQGGKLGRAGHIGTLADIDEIGLGRNVERLKTTQPAITRDLLGDTTRREAKHNLGNSPDMFRCRAAAATDDIEKAALGKFLEQPCHILGGIVITAELIGESGIRMEADVGIRQAGQLFDVGSQ